MRTGITVAATCITAVFLLASCAHRSTEGGARHCKPISAPAALPLLSEEHHRPYGYNLRGVAFSPSGDKLLSTWQSSVGREWDVKTANMLLSLDPVGLPPPPPGNTLGCGYGAAWSPDGRLLLTGSLETVPGSDDSLDDAIYHEAFLWDARTGKLRMVFVGHEKTVFKVAFTPDSKYAVTGSRDGTARVWSVETGRQICVFRAPHVGSVFAIAVSPDGRFIASGSDGDPEGPKFIRIWRTSDATEVRNFSFGTGIVMDLAFSPDGKSLAACGVSPAVALWNLSDGKRTTLLSEPAYSPFLSVKFSSDSRYVFSAALKDDESIPLEQRRSEGPESRVWMTDVESGKTVCESTAIHSIIFALSVSSDGRHVASEGTDGVRIWRIPDRAKTGIKRESKSKG